MPLGPDRIHVANVRPAYDAALACGVSADALASIGLPAHVMNDPDGSVSGRATYDHLELMAARGDYVGFLANALERHHLASLGVVGLACKTAPTLGAALAYHARFQHLTNRTAQYATTWNGPVLVITEHRSGPPSDGSVRMSDFTMLIAVRLLTLGLERPSSVLAMRSRRASLPDDERAFMESIAQCEVETGASHAAIEIDAGVLGQSLPTHDPELEGYFRSLLERAASVHRDDSNVIARARTVIRDVLLEGAPSLDKVAHAMHMSTRSLQRTLRTERTSFTALVSTTRMRLAEGYLANKSLSVSEVAYLLGYEEETSFTRAFRRHASETPSQWRAKKNTSA